MEKLFYSGYLFSKHDSIEECKNFILTQLVAGVDLDNIRIICGEQLFFKLDLSLI
jgi:hypothetical protein